MATVLVRDETLGGDAAATYEIRFAGSRTTVAELIRERVAAEVARRNAEAVGQPADSLDVEQQTLRAFDGFQRNGFFLLVNDRQVETLDEEIVIAPGIDICFMRLIPLVGG